MEFVSDWSGLHPDLLEQIATRLPLWEDLMAFRGACTTWRAAVTRNKYKFKVPLLMLSDKSQQSNFYRLRMRCTRHWFGAYRMMYGRRYKRRKCKIYSLFRRDMKLSRREKKERSHEREFYSLSKRKICARLPFPATGKKCLDVGFGWILTVSAKSDTTDGRVSLVKPYYSSPKIKLPNLKKIPNYEGSRRYPDYEFVARAMLLADPSETSDFILVLLSDIHTAIWRNGDKKWRVLLNGDKPCKALQSMIYYQGIIYATNGGLLLIWDPNGSDQARILHVDCDDVFKRFINTMTYLVESTDGELLVIWRNHHRSMFHDFIDLAEFEMMRADPKNGTIEIVKCVGKDAIFLGQNITVAIAAADYPGVLKPNCIYFTDDRNEAYYACTKGGGKDMGIYNVEDGSTERFLVESFSHLCPPMEFRMLSYAS